LVIMVYPKIPVTTMTFDFTMSNTLSADTFWAGVRAYMTYYATFTDAGTYGYFSILPNTSGGFTFTFDPFWGGNMTKPQLQALMAPFLRDLSYLGIQVTPVYAQYASLYPAWNASFPQKSSAASVATQPAGSSRATTSPMPRYSIPHSPPCGMRSRVVAS
jgi:hypothetical protein